MQKDLIRLCMDSLGKQVSHNRLFKEDIFLNRRLIRRIVSVFVVVMCIGAFGCIATAATHTDTVSFYSNSWGYSSSSHAVDLYPNTGVRTKLVSFTFNGMPSGSMPSGTTTISFKLVRKDELLYPQLLE